MNSVAAQAHTAEDKRLSVTLFILTFSTGLIDAVSFVGLGKVFTANMTGNVVFMAFAFAGVPGLSIWRSVASLAAFMVGAVIGGRINHIYEDRGRRRWVNTTLIAETSLLTIATVAAVLAGSVGTDIPSRVAYGIIVLTAMAMGLRNAVVRRLAVPDLTTTVLTLTVTGLAAESSLAGGNNKRWMVRVMAITTMFLGAFVGAVLLRYGLAVPLALSAMLPFGALLFVGMTVGDAVSD